MSSVPEIHLRLARHIREEEDDILPSTHTKCGARLASSEPGPRWRW
jgi:hypothetical protein